MLQSYMPLGSAFRNIYVHAVKGASNQNATVPTIYIFGSHCWSSSISAVLPALIPTLFASRFEHRKNGQPVIPLRSSNLWLHAAHLRSLVSVMCLHHLRSRHFRSSQTALCEACGLPHRPPHLGPAFHPRFQSEVLPPYPCISHQPHIQCPLGMLPLRFA